MSGEWGTITDSDWTDDDAVVVCRKLGHFRPGATGHSGAYFGEGRGPVNLDSVQCTGSEYSLTDCEIEDSGRRTTHSLDVGVKCQPAEGSYREGDIRLVGGPHNWEGRVEIFWSGTWGTISETDWGMPEAQVVCKQLQLPSEGSVSSPYGQGSGLIRITSVTCSGSEDNVTQCSLSMGFSSNHQNDVGVKCGKGADYKHGDIRLVGGSYSWEGRVEIYLDGEWGTITDDGADDIDAHVVCRQLGYDTQYGFDRNYHGAHFGQGVGTIHLNYLGCSGTEYRLIECYSVSSSWDHDEDWSVSCLNDVPEQGEVKLFYNYRGLLQVWLNGRWGVVSDTAWTIEDTNAVCRQLGRNGTSSTNYDYSTDLPVVMSNVECVGTESRLIDCPYTTGGSGSPVSLRCTYSAPCAHGDMRLTGGQAENEGRLEICNFLSVWGTVCNKHWTQAISKVACHSLGYGYEEGSYHRYYTFNRIPATLPIAADYVRCSGSENALRECTYFSHSFSECSHDDDIGIICPPANCEDRDVRLLGTTGSEEEGFVLVCINQRWGPICNNYNEANTKTLCRQLGYTYGDVYYWGGRRDQISAMPVQNLTLHCHGDESRIFDCTYSRSVPRRCSYYDFTSISCEPASCTDGQVRLVDGATDVEGRVEICFSRRWETISGDGWTQTESTVVCNDLGYEATGNDYSVRPATNSMPVFIKTVRCTSRQVSLLECGFRRNLTHSVHLEDVGVKCKKSECDDGDLRLVGGDSENDGLLQVCFSGRWGTVNVDGWTDVDTQVTCRQLGFNNDGQYSANAVRKALSTPIYMDNVGCHGTETRLTDCAYHRDTSEDSHSGDIWIECDPASDPGPGPEIESDDSKSGGGNNDTLEKGSQDGLAVALVALVISLLVTFALVGYIIFTKQKVLFKRIRRIHYHKSSRGKDDASVMIDNDESDSRVYVESEITHS
jgi:hypothetical protein